MFKRKKINGFIKDRITSILINSILPTFLSHCIKKNAYFKNRIIIVCTIFIEHQPWKSYFGSCR